MYFPLFSLSPSSISSLMCPLSSIFTHGLFFIRVSVYSTYTLAHFPSSSFSRSQIFALVYSLRCTFTRFCTHVYVSSMLESYIPSWFHLHPRPRMYSRVWIFRAGVSRPLPAPPSTPCRHLVLMKPLPPRVSSAAPCHTIKLGCPPVSPTQSRSVPSGPGLNSSTRLHDLNRKRTGIGHQGTDLRLHKTRDVRFGAYWSKMGQRQDNENCYWKSDVTMNALKEDRKHKITPTDKDMKLRMTKDDLKMI